MLYVTQLLSFCFSLVWTGNELYNGLEEQYFRFCRLLFTHTGLFLSSIIQHFKSSKKNIAAKSPLFHLINYTYIKKFVSKCLTTFYWLTENLKAFYCCEDLWVVSSMCLLQRQRGRSQSKRLKDFCPRLSWQPSVLHTSFPWWRSRTWTAALSWEASRWSWQGRTSALTPRWFSWRKLKVGGLNYPSPQPSPRLLTSHNF